MSSDNGFLIRSTPSGGYAAIMYFASDDEPARAFDPDRDKEYAALSDAIYFAESEYSEYGVSFEAGIFPEEPVLITEYRVESPRGTTGRARAMLNPHSGVEITEELARKALEKERDWIRTDSLIQDHKYRQESIDLLRLEVRQVTEWKTLDG